VAPGAPEAVDLTGEDDESDSSTGLEGNAMDGRGEAMGREEGIKVKQEAQVCAGNLCT
jgi:hypothetical protein